MTRRPATPLAVLVCLLVHASCQGGTPQADRDPASEPAARGRSAGSDVVRVVARDYAFEAPDEIPAGWTTFEMTNAGAEHHFFLLQRLPDGTTFEAYVREAGMPFDSVMRALEAGTVDKAAAGELLGRLLPPWYSGVRQMGGAGLLAPGRSERTTVRLEPGTYVMECYVKTAGGRFHSALGMARPLVVTEAPSEGSSPQADAELTLSSAGIAAPGTIPAHEQTVAVHYREQPQMGLGRDVHLVRLEDADLDEVLGWMDWMEVQGLRAPAPAEFLGGVQEMPEGYTAYFTVAPEPGRYAWISESPAELRMVKEVIAR